MVGIRGFFGAFVKVASGVGALLFASGWVAAHRFFARFGVVPEEVGIDSWFLVPRVGVAIGLISLITFFILFFVDVTDWRGRAVDGNLSAFHSLFVAIVLATTGLNLALLVYFTSFFTSFLSGGWNYLWLMPAVLLAVLVAGFVGVLLLVGSGYSVRRRVGPSIEPGSRYADKSLFGVASYLLLLLLALSSMTGAFLGNRVLSNEPLLASVFGVRQVDARWQSPDGTEVTQTCTFLLGRKNDQITLYQPTSDITIRVTSETVELATPGREC